MTSATILAGANVVVSSRLARADVVVRGPLIHAVHEHPAPRPIDADIIDCRDRIVVPGFVDMHVHGACGHDFGRGDIDVIARYHGGAGTTSLVATLACRDPMLLAERAEQLAANPTTQGGAEIVGIHYEGPFLNPLRAGAHMPEHLRLPDVELARHLCLAAGDRCRRVVTIAPELPGADAVIRQFADCGYLVSLGHSNATFQEARAAFGYGARHVTHLGNGMRPFHHRETGLAGAVLDDDMVSAEIIGDGVHVDPVAMRLYVRLLGIHRAALVTDAVAPCGATGGRPLLGDRELSVRDGAAYVEGGTSLAGSTATMAQTFQTAVSALDLSLVDAVHLTSTTPSRLLGLTDRGRIAQGLRADLCVLDQSLAVVAVMAAGRLVVPPGRRS